MITGTSLAGRWNAEVWCFASKVSPAFSLVVIHREHIPKKRFRSAKLLGRAVVAMPFSFKAACKGAMSGISWLDRLTQIDSCFWDALGDDAMVNSRTFCLGHSSRKVPRSKPLMSSSWKNSGILQQTGAAWRRFSSSASPNSSLTRSRALSSLIFGSSSCSILFVGALPKSQYRPKASATVHGVGNGFFSLLAPVSGKKVMALVRSLVLIPRMASIAFTSAGSFSGSTDRVPPRE
mmetsp:Transcript_493/g.1027  ORF Transcript_493/g.1027 Transcript_493/m.1027 type:complete len:235 (+) Transcript_493:748-1452(+)